MEGGWGGGGSDSEGCSEDEDRGQWEGEVQGEGPARRRQNVAAAARVVVERRAARRAQAEAEPRPPVAQARGTRRGHLVCAVNGTQVHAQEAQLAALELALATRPAAGERMWRGLQVDWWIMRKHTRGLQEAPQRATERFPGVVPAAPEERCEATTAEGTRCRQLGFLRGATGRFCRGCRLAKTGGRERLASCRGMEEAVAGCRPHHCQICGCSGGPGDEHTWGSMGRWTVVCAACVDGMMFVPELKRCGACGSGEAARGAGRGGRGPESSAWSGATDGMWFCDGGGWCSEPSMPGRVWVGRAARMRELAVGWLGLDGWPMEGLRRATLAVARAAFRYHAGGFVGNLITWGMWREAAADEWARQGFEARAATTRTIPWRGCGAVLREHVDRISTAAENERGGAAAQELGGGERRRTAG